MIKKVNPDYLLIDALSIIAKVYRDKEMIKISKNPRFQVYKWDKNKGYGTREHREAIQSYGVTKLHRKQFVRHYVTDNSVSQ